MTWVPEFAIAHNDIITYTDGRWGIHKYSKWPQPFARDMFHIACIPSKARASGPRLVCWRTLSVSDWKAADCGIFKGGFLDALLQTELVAEAQCAIKRHEQCRVSGNGWDKVGHFITVCLRHAVDRLRALPAPANVTIALAAQVQRLTLELYGMIEWLNVVMDRVINKEDHHADILEVVGAHTSNPSEAQMLYDAGIPLWFEQHMGPNVEIYKVVSVVNVPADFSPVPCVPRLVLAKRDLSGALNLPGEWVRAMAEVTRRQLCARGLPGLQDAEADVTHPNPKRPSEGVVFFGGHSSSVGPPTNVFVVKNSRDIRALGHLLSPASSTSRTHVEPRSRRAKARAAKRAAAGPTALKTTLAVNPSRQFYRSNNVTLSNVWEDALVRAGTLPQPQTSVRYYFAPPWLLDSLVGFESNSSKTARYLHHWTAIRKFCCTRLFDCSVQGRPLTVSEWRHALWGDYTTRDDDATPTLRPNSGRGKIRQDLKMGLRQLFGTRAALPSYNALARPMYGRIVVTERDAATNRPIRQMLVHDTHETNWRCELLSLDALMMNTQAWSVGQRWGRELIVSRVWGEGTSGVDIMPDEDHLPLWSWTMPPEDGWEMARPHLQSFIELLSGWPGCPPYVAHAAKDIATFDEARYTPVVTAAVDFYVSTFVAKFGRLPIVPARVNIFGEA